MNRRLYKYLARNGSVIASVGAMAGSLVALSTLFLKDVGFSSVIPILQGVVASAVGAVLAAALAGALKFASRETPSVFISYSHQDSEFAEKLSEALREINVNPIFDRIELKVGDDIRTAVDNMIDKSDYFLFVISPNSAASDWAKKEIEQAAKREKKILPVVLDVNAIPPELSGLYYADFTKSFDNGIAQLQKAVRPTGGVAGGGRSQKMVGGGAERNS